MARTPLEAKQLGRRIQHFDQAEWDRIRCSVACEVVVSKLRALLEVRQLLLSTGGALIAETAPNDTIWGIGLSTDHHDVQLPRLWRGANVLGWAFMTVRAGIRTGSVLLEGAVESSAQLP
eukprot:3013833-Prymnesium_polylepis.1